MSTLPTFLFSTLTTSTVISDPLNSKFETQNEKAFSFRISDFAFSRYWSLVPDALLRLLLQLRLRLGLGGDRLANQHVATVSPRHVAAYDNHVVLGVDSEHLE